METRIREIGIKPEHNLSYWSDVRECESWYRGPIGGYEKGLVKVAEGVRIKITDDEIKERDIKENDFLILKVENNRYLFNVVGIYPDLLSDISVIGLSFVYNLLNFSEAKLIADVLVTTDKEIKSIAQEMKDIIEEHKHATIVSYEYDEFDPDDLGYAPLERKEKSKEELRDILAGKIFDLFSRDILFKEGLLLTDIFDKNIKLIEEIGKKTNNDDIKAIEGRLIKIKKSLLK